MQVRSHTDGNSRAPATVKRSIMRTLRLFFLQGWAWYRGHLLSTADRLTAFFSAQDIAHVRHQINARRHWWFERDSHFHLRRQDGAVHLDRPTRTQTVSAPRRSSDVPLLKLLTFNCQSLGKGSSRLQELATDMDAVSVSVAALQGTRWKSDDPRGEWTVHGISGQPLFRCFSWGRPASNNMLGVQLLISHTLYSRAVVHTRFDPPHGLKGRLGGIRLVSRTPGQELDDLFITAYGPQEAAPDADRQTFFQAVLEITHAVPRRTRVWLLGDFNGHVGTDTRSPAVGRFGEQVTNNNGFSLVHACESAGLLLSNTVTGWAPTSWTPDGRHAHCIDFIAIPQAYKTRIRQCRVNQVLGRRWQLSLVRDHWPVEATVQLLRPWQLHSSSHQPRTRWNQHALQVALDDPEVANNFLHDAQAAWGPIAAQHTDFSTPSGVEAYWQSVTAVIHKVAVQHFAMRPVQRSSKILPATFDLLQQRRAAQDTLLQHMHGWINVRRRDVLRWFFAAIRFFASHSRCDRACKAAVKHDNKQWESRLEARLQQAIDFHDTREAWATSRQLAGHGRSRIIDRAVPAAKLITEQQWEKHMKDIWGATRHNGAVVQTAADTSAQLQVPLLRGELGRQQLLTAARAQPRCRATPEGSLPAELWCLIMQTGQVAAEQPTWTATEAVRFFEAAQTLGYNPQAWCDGFGCAVPKKGGSPGPGGQRIINLLDPGGKMFYKALWNATPDHPAAHQYGYAAGRSRRDAILHVEAWLDRLRFNKLHTAAILFDLTKAFDTLNLPSIEQAVLDTRLQPAAEQLLLDLHRRLRIRLPLQRGGLLQVKLQSGVLQGGGTGPRIFRIAYDSCVLEWEQALTADESEFLVDYAGQQLFLGIAAYADDLIRIVPGRDLHKLATTAQQNLASLEGVLRPRNLQLNERKGETLLSFSGKGAYKAARDAHAGHWPCYPPKLVVKYLGAQLHATGSLSAEIRKRAASAKAGFARFARFFKRSQVPLPRKVLVFKAVVNEALLSALEVRPLSSVDEQALERARGLLLRRRFGRQGYGAVAGDPQHRSVTLESLRRRANLATVASELRVRRLLWLRKALLREQEGQTRLELAALFGVSNKLHDTLTPGTGAPSQHAPRFLHLLFRDLQSVLVGFSGFSGNWQTSFLQVSADALRRLRTVCSPQAASAAADVAVLQADANASGDDEPAAVPAVAAPPVPVPADAAAPVPVFSCALVNNHGHAGALAGQRIAAQARAPAQRPPAAPAVNQRSIAEFFARHAEHGLPAAASGDEPINTASQAHTFGRAAGSRSESSRAASEGTQLEAGQGVSTRCQPRPQHSGDGGLEHPHLDFRAGERARHFAHEPHEPVEAASSSTRPATSARPCPSHSRRGSGQVVVGGSGSSSSHAQVHSHARRHDWSH